jgi:hypothetical protein
MWNFKSRSPGSCRLRAHELSSAQRKRSQYLGYQAQGSVRAYRFRVADAGREEREFTLSVSSQCLTDSHFKCQDAPALCLAKLKEGLSSETPEHVLPLQLTVSEADLRKYVETHYPAKSKQGHDDRRPLRRDQGAARRVFADRSP